jgi:hypothetical protein
MSKNVSYSGVLDLTLFLDRDISPESNIVRKIHFYGINS